MKILVCGDWHSHLHEEPLADAFIQLGHTVQCFKWHQYFAATHSPFPQPVNRLLSKAQYKYIFGSPVSRLNRDFVDLATRVKPGIVFIYRGTHIRPSSLRSLRYLLPQCVIVGYNNDDPFSPRAQKGLWRNFKACLPLLDLALAYRKHNIDDFRSAGAKRVELLRSWYVPQNHHPLVLSSQQRAEFATDVVFIGHYESDMRLACLEEVVRRGYRMKLFGPPHEWSGPLASSPILSTLNPVRPLWGEEYNVALNAAAIALCFFSKLNRDTYTRRCFEIPASGTMLLCEFSSDMAAMFRPGIEADYFTCPAELGDKLDTYLLAPALRSRIANSGNIRVAIDKHDVLSRMEAVLALIQDIRRNQ